ncbi:MAG: ZIP family metal transporter [Acidobacteria bacterium]|nr:ZIP family metal transporter [Acidobacteriota bacterium]MBV9478886.1 ZIP family metal transporter [Acidobacteriota bacterium]
MSAVWALLAFVMTLAGGGFAFRYRSSLQAIMAFSAGLLIGVVFLDLMPELFDLSHSHALPIRWLTLTVVGGFVGIFLLEKLTIIHSEKSHDTPGHHHNVGLAGAIGLSFHSFLDGLAIGVGFQAGNEVGIVVLLAVVAHDFADGLNTVTFMLATRNSRWRTLSLLIVDALAPVAGALLTNVLHIDPRILAFQLAFFAGFLLYLGASDLLPHVHERPRPALIFSTLAGLATAGGIVAVLEQL